MSRTDAFGVETAAAAMSMLTVFDVETVAAAMRDGALGGAWQGPGLPRTPTIAIVPVRSLVPRPRFEKDTFSGGYNNTIRERNEQRRREWLKENLNWIVLNSVERQLYVPEPALPAFHEALEKAGFRKVRS